MPAAKSITRSCRAYPIPEIGQTFGRWTIVAPAESAKTGHRRWLCQCSCGTERIVSERNFRPCSTRKNPMSLSCGCWRDERVVANSTTHGHTSKTLGGRTSEYIIWVGIIARCTNHKGTNYHMYGGRGIQVCDRWLNSFEAFLEDMGPKPSPDHQIDRFPDNGGNYEPGNCRWATRSENMNNRDCNLRLEHDGKVMTCMEWSKETGIGYSTIRERLNRGWSASQALTTSIDTRCRRKTRHASSA